MTSRFQLLAILDLEGHAPLVERLHRPHNTPTGRQSRIVVTIAQKLTKSWRVKGIMLPA
ncbi:hypothetical protein HW511_04110 [Asaia siamensis]|uniref:hypothetical protein n=1 Tax=Asaia siamensis TaxID=110479 RepID=UPI001669CF68|nr:hypothetical protein [Asaia siamensis]